MRGRPVRSVDHETHPPDTNFPEYRGVNELLAVLTSYRDVVATAWPALYPGLADRAARWPALDAAALRDELETLLRDASAPPSPLRVFWKLAPELRFGGCSAHFASDAGLASPAELVGMDDFDLRLPWRDQGAKYRADDETVMRTGYEIDKFQRAYFVLPSFDALRDAFQTADLAGIVRRWKDEPALDPSTV